MNFVALDVETANPDLASICQVGLVTFSAGRIVDTWQSLVNPEDDFDVANVSIHGITEAITRNSPTFPSVANQVQSILSRRVVATHTPFDRIAMNRACLKYGIAPFECIWLDTARVARRAWPKFAAQGYGLRNIADELGIQFEHHNAQEDARVSGVILLHAIAQTGISLDEWLNRATQPMSATSGVSRVGNIEGPLAGEVIVFTGTLTLPRREAAYLAAQAGCDVSESVNKKTTLLVVGDQDIRRLAGRENSSKHRKAEELISKGQPIRILGESDFMRIVKSVE